MDEPVKPVKPSGEPSAGPRRQYDSRGRRAQARQNRTAVLRAARDLFLDHGYTATKMATVAAAAGVSVETVYKVFENKAGLLAALIDTTIAGDDEEPLPDPDREAIDALWAEPDPAAKLRGYGKLLGRRGAQVQPLQLLARQAAESDPAAAEVYQKIRDARLANTTLVAGFLDGGPYLRPGVSLEEARDVLWMYNSAEIWDLLVVKRGWTPERYGTWIGEALVAALL
jgi:AcrR family transcriptional regulator